MAGFEFVEVLSFVFDAASHDRLTDLSVGGQLVTGHRLGKHHHGSILVALIFKAGHPVGTVRSFKILKD